MNRLFTSLLLYPFFQQRKTEVQMYSLGIGQRLRTAINMFLAPVGINRVTGCICLQLGVYVFCPWNSIEHGIKREVVEVDGDDI
jgi:hypothetical protein